MASSDLAPATYGCSPALLLNYASGSSRPVGSVDGAVPGERATGVSSVSVHPIVLLSVLDHHTRRQEGAGRVIGTLLGKRDGDRMEITNCFAVPHAERGDEVAIGKDFNRQMLALHLRANKRESVVGWYATALPDEVDASASKCIADTSSLIHEFYAGECDDEPVHLVVDTSLNQDAIALRAYKSTPVSVRGEPLANLFHEIRLSLRSSESERICLDRMLSAPRKPPSSDEAADLQLSMQRLLAMLDSCSDYVDAAVAGTTPPDDQLGRDIMETLNSVPSIRPDVFDKMFNDSLQDLLMVTYLSNITKTQLTIAEKLNATLTT